MWFTRVSLANPVFATMLMLALVVLGVFSYQRLRIDQFPNCLLYTSDAADERSSVDLGGRRIIKKKKTRNMVGVDMRWIQQIESR